MVKQGLLPNLIRRLLLSLITGLITPCVMAQTALTLQDEKSAIAFFDAHQTLHHIFQNPDWDNKQLLSFPEKQGILTLKEYKAQLRKAFAVQLNEHVELGLDRFKVGPLNTQKNAMSEYESHLQQGNRHTAIARGYGVELRIKLD
jgi:hypothetical protein